VADDPDQKIHLKVFHAEILNDHEAIRKEENDFRIIPGIRLITYEEIQENFFRIKRDIAQIAERKN
jgi:hypothetical protein